MTRIEDFRRELRILLKGVTKEFLPDEKIFQSIERGQRILSFPREIAGAYFRSIQILRVQSLNIGKLLSDKELTNLLVDFLFELKSGDEAKALTEIDKHINDIFRRIRAIKIQRHLFIMPIMNLAIGQHLAIGDSLIANLDEKALAFLESKYFTKLRFLHEEPSITVKKMKEENETSVFAIVSVEAPDDEKALELAIQKADTCLNVLRLFEVDARFVLRDEFHSRFVRGMVHLNLDKKSYSKMLGPVNAAPKITGIGPHEMDLMNRHGLKRINELLCKEPEGLSSLQHDLLTAIMWFGNAVKEQQRSMKLIMSAIALETVLIPDGGKEKRSKLSKRFASIFYASASNDEKKDVFRKMRNLYDIRNSIIHSGRGYVFEDDLNQMLYWTQAAIQMLLRYVESFDDISELIETKFPINEALYRNL